MVNFRHLTLASFRDVRQHVSANCFCVTSFGESHGPGDRLRGRWMPAGIWNLAREEIQHDLDRRKPGTSRHVTQRHESDSVEILSGVFEGKTTGTSDCTVDT